MCVWCAHVSVGCACVFMWRWGADVLLAHVLDDTEVSCESDLLYDVGECEEIMEVAVANPSPNHMA